MIIIPGRFVETKDPIGLELGIEGWFVLRAIKNGRVVRTHKFKDQKKQTDPFQNLILNSGLDRFGSDVANAVYPYFYVGTGTSTPSNTQVTLDARVGNPFQVNTSTISNSDAPNYYSARIFNALSTVGAFGTVNLTEIGIGSAIGTNILFSRALIVDSNGNPVAFPISSDEQLQASYELRLYPPLTDATTTVNVSGSRTVIVRAINIANTGYWGVQGHSSVSNNTVATGAISGQSAYWWTGDLNTLTSTAPQGSAVSNSTPTITNNSYVSSSYNRTCRYSWTSTNANGTLRTQGVKYNCCQFQVQYDPPLVKTSDQSMYLDYRLSWARR